MKKAAIFCNGIIEDYDYLRTKNFKGIFLICADGGLSHMEELGLVPDVIIGDNDSWREKYPECAKTIICPAEKDYTDTQRCVDYAVESGAKEIEIIGGLGGRRDHEFSHYCLLAYGLNRGVNIKITDRHNEIWIADKPFALNKSKKKYVSFFPFGGCVEGFSVSGLKYSADGMRLQCDLVQASSNEFGEAEVAMVNFSSGKLLIMLCDDAQR